MKISWNLAKLFSFSEKRDTHSKNIENNISHVGATAINRGHNSCDTFSKSRKSPLFRAVLLVGLVAHGRSQLANPFPAQFELSSLDGSNGFVICGVSGGDESGISLSGAGDFNGDGIDDILIGAHGVDHLGVSDVGKAYVVFGSRLPVDSGVLDLSKLDATSGLEYIGEERIDRCGSAVSSAGDVNGDGVDDILIGAYGAEPMGIRSAGVTYVLFGKKSGFNSQTLELSDLTRNDGYVIRGQPINWLGSAVSAAGDLNGDHIDDLAVGAWQAVVAGNSQVGKTYVHFGTRSMITADYVDVANFNGLNGFVIEGEDKYDYSGRAISAAGDVNEDGIDDLLIGARTAKAQGIWRAGKSYVVFGQRKVIFGGQVKLSGLNGTGGFKIYGDQSNDQSGYSVSAAGDFNGDQIADIIIGAPFADPSQGTSAGMSYVIYGNRSIGNSGYLELSKLDGMKGFSILGEAIDDYSGYSVSTVGDFNGDGLSDIVIGATDAQPAHAYRPSAGRSYVLFGSPTTGNSGSFQLSNINGYNGFVLNGETADDQSGYDVSHAGDVNGDGVDDLLIGAPLATCFGRVKSGKSYVIFGRNLSHITQPPTPQPTTAATTFQSTSKGATSISSSVTARMTRLPSFESSRLPSSELQKTGIVKQNTSYTMLEYIDDPSTVSPKTGTINEEQFETSLVVSNSNTIDTTPLIAGMAATIAALACSLFTGGFYFLWKKGQVTQDDTIEMNKLKKEHKYDCINATPAFQRAGDDEMQSARFEGSQSITQNQGIYTTVSTASPLNNYNEWPEQPTPSDPNQYTSIDKVEKQHDAYVAAKFEKAHENYDDLPT